MYSFKDIPIGRENAISRTDLAKLWGCNDRTARERIADMRCKENDGFVIVSHSNSGPAGYYRTNDPIEIQHFVNEMEKRARSTFRPLWRARILLKRIQMEQRHGKGIAG
jgi:hypothetical protein